MNLNLPDSLETIGKYCFSGDMKIQIIDMSQAPDALIEKRTLISGTASLPSVLVRATGGQASQGWGIRSENNDGEDPTQYARWYEESGKLYLEAVSSGRVILETFDNYTGARGSKLLEIRGGTVIRPAEPGYLVSGEKLALSAWKMPAETQVSVQWSLAQGDEQYASISTSGLLTARAVSEAHTITVTATPTDGSEPATRTLRILPKTTGMSLALEGSILGRELSVDMSMRTSLTLTARQEPEDALQGIAWSSSSGAVASVDEGGTVTLHKPGTVTVTAALRGDPLGRKASLKITVIPLQVQELELIPSVGDSRAQVIEDENSQRLHHRQHPRRQGQLPADAHPPSGGDGPDRHPATALTLNLQVYQSEKLGLSLSAKGKLDTLNPDSAITYTLTKLTNCSGIPQSVSLEGPDADKFHAELDTSGEKPLVKLTMQEGQTYATNVTYKVQLCFRICGRDVLSTVQSVKVTQSALKLTAPKTMSLYQSQTAPLRAAVTLTAPAGAQIGEITLAEKNAQEVLAAFGDGGFSARIEGSTAVLSLDPTGAAGLKAGKSYTLLLDVTPANNAVNLKPTQLKLTVKILK